MTQAPKGEDGLTVQQRKFAAEYVKDHNAKAAAIRAGYSPKTAADTGWKLTLNPAVAAEIKRNEQNILDMLQVTAYSVLKVYVDALSHKDPWVRLKAADALGKRLGFTEKIELVGNTVFRLEIPKPQVE